MKEYSKWIDEDKKMIIIYDNNLLLEKYYQSFIHLIKSRVQVDEIIKDDNKIKFRCSIDDKIEFKIWNIYTQFISQTWDAERKRMEFIPLDISSVDEETFNRIVKEKRNINFIKNSSELELISDGADGSINQYLVDYNDEDEYTDIILALKNNKFNELKNKYIKKLKLVYWW